jgi:hypothetical protein
MARMTAEKITMMRRYMVALPNLATDWRYYTPSTVGKEK